jgi:outer membrane protein assembly factor BamB
VASGRVRARRARGAVVRTPAIACAAAVLAAAAAGASSACGARTDPLLLAGGSGTGAGGASNGSSGGAVLQGACAAKLLPNAPTPMRGYCPTRANQATIAGPRAPAVAWTARPVTIDDPSAFRPAEIVVDDTGHVFAAIAASPLNPGGANVVVALDPDGHEAWRSSFGGTVAGLALGADGTLWMLEQAPGDGGTNTGAASVVGVARDGRTVATYVASPADAGSLGPFPQPYDSMAIGSDGSFFLEASADYTSGALVRMSPLGAVDWTGPNFDNGSYGGIVGPIMLAPDDTIVSAGGQEIATYSPADGNLEWNTGFAGSASSVAAVDTHGGIVSLVANGDALSLQTLGPGGALARNLPLPTVAVTLDACHVAVGYDGSLVAMLAEESPAPGATKAHATIVAFDPQGNQRWTAPLDSSLPYDPAATSAHYGLFVDAAGTVVVSAGTVTALDGATGATLWTVTPPTSSSCVRPAVLGAGASIVLSQCDGTIFLARDP